MELLADLIQQQEHVYSNKIQKRQAGDTSVTNRNVFFVVDSSGSIPANTYGRVLDILANFAKLLCGDVAIGMFTLNWSSAQPAATEPTLINLTSMM